MEKDEREKPGSPETDRPSIGKTPETGDPTAFDVERPETGDPITYDRQSPEVGTPKDYGAGVPETGDPTSERRGLS